jgi:hypothetical protein
MINPLTGLLKATILRLPLLSTRTPSRPRTAS